MFVSEPSSFLLQSFDFFWSGRLRFQSSLPFARSVIARAMEPSDKPGMRKVEEGKPRQTLFVRSKSLFVVLCRTARSKWIRLRRCNKYSHGSSGRRGGDPKLPQSEHPQTRLGSNGQERPSHFYHRRRICVSRGYRINHRGAGTRAEQPD